MGCSQAKTGRRTDRSRRRAELVRYAVRRDTRRRPSSAVRRSGAYDSADDDAERSDEVGAALMPERTLLLIKPDGVERRLVGEIISRIERKGLTVAALELRIVSDELARRHYAEHDGKPFFASLLEFITSGPLVAAIAEGPRAVAAVRQLAGATDPVEKAAPGTIRGDFGLETQFNLVHGSDSPESAEREIALWFAQT
jgi:nucleoside-diphosphate kinase